MSSQPPVDILVVDDNRAKITAIEAALAPLGQNLITASSGREALRHLLARSFATVVLDVNMPDMDGFQTAQLIRGRTSSASTPIIFVSAVNLSDADALRGYSLGAVDYITAPIVPEVLRAKVSVFVELHRKTAEARRNLEEVRRRTVELEASQHQLRLVERMAALGTLCAGLGHDMGNLLLPVRMRLDGLVRNGVPDGLAEDIGAIRECAEYLQRLSNGLRMLTLNPDDPSASREATSFEEWWSEAGQLVRNALPKPVRLETSFDPRARGARMPRHTLTQVVFNLVQNAADAMRECAEGSAVTVATRASADPRFVTVIVSDNGPGMSEEVRRRCLEPFFTTKTRGVSTGLGLALVHTAVQRSGGWLKLDSEPGLGTTFTLGLPAIQDEGAAAVATRPVAAVSVDDDRTRAFVDTVLTSLGFGVVRPANGHASACEVLVTESAAEASRALENPRTWRVLLMGGEAGREDKRLVVLGDRPALSSMREALRSIAVAPASEEVACATDPGCVC